MYRVYLLNKDQSQELYVIDNVMRFSEQLHTNTTLTNGTQKDAVVQRLDIIVHSHEDNKNLLKDMAQFVNDTNFNIVIHKLLMDNETEIVFNGENYTEFSNIALVGDTENELYTFSWSKQLQ